MLYVFTLDVPIDEATYRRVIDEIGPEPMPGALLHLCVQRPEGGLRYIDVWESEDAYTTALAERIAPAVNTVLGRRPMDTDPAPAPLEVLHATGALLTTAG
jgi:hypothetical protein